MYPILFFSLVIILGAALPWCPYSAYGRLRHYRPWDWLVDTPSSEDIKIFDQQREPLGRVPTLEASQQPAMKLCDTNSETHLMQEDDLLKRFEEAWFAQTQGDDLLKRYEEAWFAQSATEKQDRRGLAPRRNR
jgi:hypothetical protein